MTSNLTDVYTQNIVNRIATGAFPEQSVGNDTLKLKNELNQIYIENLQNEVNLLKLKNETQKIRDELNRIMNSDLFRQKL